MKKLELINFILNNFEDDDVKWVFYIDKNSMSTLWYYIWNIEYSKKVVSCLPCNLDDEVRSFYKDKMNIWK